MARKHLGRMIKSKKRVIVAYRVVPEEADNCIVVNTETLDAGEHDTLMNLVESEGGQNENDLASLMMRTSLPDGRNMLTGFHTTGKLMKMPTNEIEMLPDSKTTIPLNELNEIIAQQLGVTVEDLAVKGDIKKPAVTQTETTPVKAAPTLDVITDEDLAAKYRSDADRLFKEAKSLREQAEELAPTKRKTSKTAESA
jgi:hypothetical protein